jgi:tetratricopeptide (TPR) repeat protein
LQSHQCQRALEVYKQAEAMVVSTSGADSPAACLARRKLAGAHMTLGELLQGDKQYVPAREQYEAALAMLEKVGPSLIFQPSLQSHARVVLSAPVVRNPAQVFGTQSDKVTPVLDSLGDLTRRMRLLEDSDAFYQRALTLRIDAHSRPTMAVGETLRNLGITAQCRGLYEQAEDFYVRALHIVSTGGSEMDASRQELEQTLIALRYAMGKN